MNKIYICLLMILSVEVFAMEIYRYVDAQGVIHFTDHPITGSSGSSVKFNKPQIRSVQIYRYIDQTGTVHLSDTPKNAKYALIYSGPEFISSMSGRSSAQQVMRRKYVEYNDEIRRVANLTGVDAGLIHAVIQVESAYNPKAVSPKGATGLMQLMPATAKRFGVIDRTDIAENLYGGAKYLSFLLDHFNNDLELALAGYNAGEGAVRRHGNRIPPYRETQNYVVKVLELYKQHRLNM
jgi:hypothetical protein